MDLTIERIEDLMTFCRDCHARIHDNDAIQIAFPKSAPKWVAERINADAPTSV